MTKKQIIEMYRAWRKENNNRKPNRVIVRMHWEDEPERSQVDTIGIIPQALIGWTENQPGDALILYYASSLQGLYELTKPGNGSDFILDEVCEFYRV